MSHEVTRSIAISTFCFALSCAGSSEVTPQFTPKTGIYDCITMTQGTKYILSGFARYEQPQLQNTAVYLNLSSPSISVKPIRQALVQVIDIQADRILAWTTTDETGFYKVSYDEPEGSNIRVRVLARTYANSQNPRYKSDDRCNLFLSVLDNTAGGALYAVSSVEAAKGSGIIDVRATYGANSRGSAPFSILDAGLAATDTILTAKSDITFKSLNFYWSSANTNVSGNVQTGLIGTSYFGQDVFGDVGKGAIYLLGAAGVDTDEYDANVIIHEFGHYLEYSVYRSDSVGGTHSLTALVDLSLAFSEGWGNFFSAYVRQNSVYTDSNGTNNSSGFNFNLETNFAGNIYTERAVQNALWDITDAANDAGDSIQCSLGVISGALLGLKSDSASSSYLSFANNLQNQAPVCIAGGLNSIHSNMNFGNITNSFNSTVAPDTTTGGSCRTAPYITAALPYPDTSQTLNLSFSNAGVNNYCALKWYRVTGDGTQRTVQLKGITASCNLDLYVTQKSSVVASSRSATLGASETISLTFVNGVDYVIRVHTVTPTTGTCTYTLSIT